MCYISTNQNRFYSALEQAYGFVAPVYDKNRLPAVKLSATQELEKAERRDKTGSRTFGGIPHGVRRRTSFGLTTYMTSWAPADVAPTYDPLFVAATGGTPRLFGGGTLAAISGTQITFTSAHGLSAGQGISCGGEIRFVRSIVDGQTVRVNAPFTNSPRPGWPVDRTITYCPGPTLGSVSIYDYWSPQNAVHRILAGAAIDVLSLNINGDFHEFRFKGAAGDLVDSASFESGQGGLTGFPAEPTVTALDYPVIPGNLGQAWLGSGTEQFLTVTSAEIELDNNLDMRAREFGSSGPRCVTPGQRAVRANFSLYEQPDAQTKTLYQAARQRSPISVMFQLGIQTTQLCGVYLKSVVPEVPEYEDDEARLEWRFRHCRAQGTIDDEIYIAFA
ncbi:MAG: hypothetical protein KIT09_27695 [Bryobacteraceae bacterium]|nr:hypothetical protein [Bryobacteraceae bacterium]